MVLFSSESSKCMTELARLESCTQYVNQSNTNTPIMQQWQILSCLWSKREEFLDCGQTGFESELSYNFTSANLFWMQKCGRSLATNPIKCNFRQICFEIHMFSFTNLYYVCQWLIYLLNAYQVTVYILSESTFSLTTICHFYKWIYGEITRCERLKLIKKIYG